VQALGDGGGVAEEAGAERAREALREHRALHPHEPPRSSSVPFRACRRGQRGALGHGAAHARRRGAPPPRGVLGFTGPSGSLAASISSAAATVTLRRALRVVVWVGTADEGETTR
jgi:hypothetical protein